MLAIATARGRRIPHIRTIRTSLSFTTIKERNREEDDETWTKNIYCIDKNSVRVLFENGWKKKQRMKRSKNTCRSTLEYVYLYNEYTLTSERTSEQRMQRRMNRKQLCALCSLCNFLFFFMSIGLFELVRFLLWHYCCSTVSKVLTRCWIIWLQWWVLSLAFSLSLSDLVASSLKISKDEF